MSAAASSNVSSVRHRTAARGSTSVDTPQRSGEVGKQRTDNASEISDIHVLLLLLLLFAGIPVLVLAFSGDGSLPVWALQLAASSAATIIAETTTLPFDVAKVRIQCDSRRYSGLLHALHGIVVEDGVLALWKGLCPSCIRILYHSVSIVLYEPIRDILMAMIDRAGLTNTLVQYAMRTFAGGLSGGVAIALFNPVDVAKTQMMNSSGRTQAMMSVLRNVVQVRGLVGLWAGVVPNVLRCALVNAAELGTYDEAKEMLEELVESKPAQHVLAAAVAAFAAGLISTPVDVAKTRLMNESKQKEKGYDGMSDAISKIYSNEGFIALYSGFVAIICLKVSWCIVFFHTYEELQVLVK